MNRNFLYFIICITLYSCKPSCEDDPNLSSDELSWLTYSNGQMAIFKNDTGAIDTVYAKISFELHCPLTDDNGCNHCYQSGESSLTNFKDLPNAIFLIGIDHYNKWFPSNMNSVHFGNSANLFSHDIPQNNVTINNKTYNNVYNFGGTYYSKANGIISFTTGTVHWYRVL